MDNKLAKRSLVIYLNCENCKDTWQIAYFKCKYLITNGDFNHSCLFLNTALHDMHNLSPFYIFYASINWFITIMPAPPFPSYHITYFTPDKIIADLQTADGKWTCPCNTKYWRVNRHMSLIRLPWTRIELSQLGSRVDWSLLGYSWQRVLEDVWDWAREWLVTFDQGSWRGSGSDTNGTCVLR